MATTVADLSNAPGIIAADSLYTLAEIKERLKLGDHALRMARKSGLKVRRIGRRAYVLGRDLISYAESHANPGSAAQ